jgi:hypothetical protein
MPKRKHDIDGFGRRLRELRETMTPPLPARRVDHLAGLTPGHTRVLEGTSSKASPKHISAYCVFKLADVFGAEMAWLYLGRGRKPAANDVEVAVAVAEKEPFPREGRGAARSVR